MSLWQRLRGVLRPSAPRQLGEPPPKKNPAVGAARRVPSATSDEDDAQRIYTYARRIGPLDERPERCDPEILAALIRLWQSGHQGQAVALGGGLASALPHDARLQLAVAELLCVQRDYHQAVPLLQRALDAAVGDSEPRLRARFLLHEAALAADAAVEAMTQLRHLLAEDFFYPGARTRLAALEARTGRTTGGAPLLAESAQLAVDGARAAGSLPTIVGAKGALLGATHERYQLLRELGCGSAGTVYLALDAELGCELALKVFHPRLGGGGPALLRALHEARLLAAVRHPGVIALYDISGELPEQPDAPGSGPPRLAMELCRGGALRARLRSGPLSLVAALRRAVELIDTLAAVHRTGIVHGDVKPENLLFRGPGLHRTELPDVEAAFGDLVLSDFGLARLADRDEAASRGVGTLGYLAPERLRGEAATPASDIYSAAVVVGEMLSDALAPTRGEALQGSLPLHAFPAARWRELTAPLGHEGLLLRTLLEQCQAPSPADRPTAAEALERFSGLAASLVSGTDA